MSPWFWFCLVPVCFDDIQIPGFWQTTNLPYDCVLYDFWLPGLRNLAWINIYDSAWSRSASGSLAPIRHNIHIWRLCWLSLKDLDLLPPEKLHSGTWGMARSSILLKNLTPLVVGNVLGGKNLLIFGTINVNLQISLAPPYWMNHGSRRAPEGLRQYWQCLGWSSTDDSSEKSIFRHFSAVHNLPSGVRNTVS